MNLYLETEHGPKLLGSVHVVRIEGLRVRLGFEFGEDVRIIREEIDDLKVKVTA